MSVNVDVAAEGPRLPVSRLRIADAVRTVLAAERVTHALVSVSFHSDRAMAVLNRRHLDHHGPTDVISFGFRRELPGDPVIGDIYIAPDVARRNAAEQGCGVREEILRLVVHGALHVLGYDHPDGESRLQSPMWRRQERFVRRLMGPAT